MIGRLKVIANLEFSEKITQARELSWQHFGKVIYFYTPGLMHHANKRFRSNTNYFPSISITGSFCALNCKHCESVFLRTMIPARTPKELVEVCRKAKKRGALGCLISGGCISDGSVPLEKFTESIEEVKRKFKLKVVVHTGLLNVKTARKLEAAGVDCVSIDIIGSDETIEKVYNLNASTQDYLSSLHALSDSGLSFTPHVLVGLHQGKLKGEFKALKMIAGSKPSALIFIVFFPIKGTQMENVHPPSPRKVTELLVKARFSMPQVPMVLGCARPKGLHRSQLDILAIEAGVNGLASPSIEAVKYAKQLGLKSTFSKVCCSLIAKEPTGSI